MLFSVIYNNRQPISTDLSVTTKNYILESLKYILKKEGFYNNFVVLKNRYRKIKKDFFILFPGGKLYTGNIKYILENPLYKGIAHYKENNVENKDLALY